LADEGRDVTTERAPHAAALAFVAARGGAELDLHVVVERNQHRARAVVEVEAPPLACGRERSPTDQPPTRDAELEARARTSAHRRAQRLRLLVVVEQPDGAHELGDVAVRELADRSWLHLQR